jgi:hypothetical protein
MALLDCHKTAIPAGNLAKTPSAPEKNSADVPPARERFSVQKRACLPAIFEL